MAKTQKSSTARESKTGKVFLWFTITNKSNVVGEASFHVGWTSPREWEAGRKSIFKPEYKVDLEKQITTSSTDINEVMRFVERVVFEFTNERPSARDIFQITGDYPNIPRHISFLPDAGWPLVGQTQEEADKVAKKRTRQRNKLLLNAFKFGDFRQV